MPRAAQRAMVFAMVFAMNATTADPQDEVLTDDENALRELAVLRLKKRRDFKTQAVVYVLVNSVI